MAENLGQMLASRAEVEDADALFEPDDDSRSGEQPPQIRRFASRGARHHVRATKRKYLDARATIERSFGDLKTHQILTFSAMQGALDALFEDLAPERIDQSVEPERGLGALISSRKAKLRDIYVERWRAKTKRADGRLFEAFIALFAQAYDRLQGKDS